MLRDETDIPVQTTPVDPTRTLARAATGGPALAALRQARALLEQALDRNDAWRALSQLEAREQAGEWLDVMESDILRDRLTQTLAADPNFMASQFVTAAIASLDADEQAQQTANSDTAAGDAAGATAAPDLAPTPPMPATPVISVSAANGSSAGTTTRTPPPLPGAQQLLLPPMRALSLRIPTLLPHDMRAAEPPALPKSTAPTPAATAPPNDDTRFDPHAIGIEEADVQIVRRSTPKPSLVNTKLPPLPLSSHPTTAPARLARTPVAKWADNDAGEPDDYRPIGAASDEAQVTIISTRDQDEARARAERRAMGIAPDREAQMKRFLKALSGE